MILQKVLSLQDQPIKFQMSEIIANVYHLQFESRKDLTSTLVRFEEFYESPQFRNKVFSMEEFYSWYKTSKKHGRFTYFSDWSGFNFPSYVFKPFWNKQFNNLTKREKKVLQKFPETNNKFYIIGTYKSNIKDQAAVLKHELAHALYYIDSGYRRKVNKILKLVKNQNSINKYLANLGYHSGVFLDETHAYYLTESEDLKKAKISISSKVAHLLESNYQTYLKKYS